MTKSKITIRSLYPDLTSEELEEADFNLGCYVELVLSIHDRLEAAKEQPAINPFPEIPCALQSSPNSEVDQAR